MYFSAKVEESLLQTDAENRGEAGQELLGGRPGGSSTAVPAQGVVGARAALWMMVGAGFLCSLCPFFCPWELCAACPASLSPCPRPASGHTCPVAQPPARCVPMCANTAQREGGDPALIPSCHMQGIGLQPRAPIILILACRVLATS